MNIKKTVLYILLFFSPLTLLSQEETVLRLKKHIEVLTSDSLMGRMAGTPGEKAASVYIQKELSKLGMESMFGDKGETFSFLSTFGDTISSQNVAGIIEGYDPKLRDELIVVGAHYDHLGFNKLEINGRDVTQIFRGANDNASGTAVMIEVARELVKVAFDLRRSVIFIAFGASEKSLTGSWYFLDSGQSFKDKIKLMINIDQVGTSEGEYHPIAYIYPSVNQLTDIVKNVSAKPVMILPEIRGNDTFSSDHINFVLQGIPVIMFTTALRKTLPSEKEENEKLDLDGMASLTHYISELVHTAANMDTIVSDTSAKQKDGVEKSEKSEGERVYTLYDVDKRPTFLNGGEEQFLKRWVYDYVKYPKAAIENGIQGKVIVEFIIEKDGSVTSVKVVKSAGDLLDAEAVKVISASPKWKPGMKGGEAVRVKMAVPVEFKLRK
jgi:TonB family protein